jgi:glutaconate CoA-transferase, subunit B
MNPTAEEVMRIVAARALRGHRNCFVGIGAPSAAANLARRIHNPGLVLIYESGTIGAKPDILPLSIGDGELAETADTVVSVPEIFGYWLQAGRVDVGFLGAAQIDRFGRLNSTVIGAYEHPSVRLPGAGGAPEIAAAAREVVIMLRQRPEAFVEALDFVTSVGRPSSVITDLGVLVPDPATGELTLSHVHPGVTVDQVRKATGWPLRVAPDVAETEPVTGEELRVLRNLEERSARAHHAHRT